MPPDQVPPTGMASTEGSGHVLVLAIVQAEDAPSLVDALVQQGIGVTRLTTAGGFLRQGNATILTVVPRGRVPTVFATLRRTCQCRTKFLMPLPDSALFGEYWEPIEVEVGGAVVFVLPVERVVTLRPGTRPPAAPPSP